jgi:hypothetical protein
MSALRYATDRFHAGRAWSLAHFAARAHRRPNFLLDRGRPGHGNYRRLGRSPGCESTDSAAYLPGDPGFGSPVFGLHLYTWCFIAFGCQIMASAVFLIASTWLEDSKVRGPMTTIAAAAFVFVVVANLVSVIAEAGLNWGLPADPTGYLLFK